MNIPSNTISKKLRKLAQPILSLVLALSLIISSPLVALAAEDATVASQQTATTTPTEPQTPPTGPTTDPGPTVDPGPQKPTGDSASTYTYNKDTGNWENDHYIWDPTTHQSRPKDVPDYFFDPATGTWSSQQWTYDASTGRYVATPVVLSKQAVDALGLAQPSSKASINNTGPGSNNQSTVLNNSNGFFDLFSRTEVANYFNMNSLSGNALVNGNTKAGDAITGDANTLANILNLLRSAWDLSGGQLMSFVKNVYGDLNGDIMLNLPTINSASNKSGSSQNNSIGNTGSNSNNTIDGTNNGDVTINATNLNTINNNLDLAARSGDASVSGNTEGGNAKSGNANVLLNLLNLIGSAISARQSFFGVLNVYGNFTGDVLLPQNFLNSLIASNAPSGGSSNSINTTGSNSNNQITENHNRDLLSNTQNIDTIANNITTDARSGNANVDNNTQAGSAKTGDANSQVTLLNLTGHNVVAENAVLVFVNVFGKWLGLIMDAPQGATSAVLGGGVQSDQLNSSLPEGSTTLNNTNQNTINNNLNLSARSGNADVSGNTKAGDATSGDAKIAANVGNIINSTFGLSKFFGVFIINVFGDWLGSFGIDTPYGNTPMTNASTNTATQAGTDIASSNAVVQNIVSGSQNIGQMSQQTSSVNSDAGAKSEPQMPTHSTTRSASNPYFIPFLSLLALLVAGMLYRVSRKSGQ